MKSKHRDNARAGHVWTTTEAEMRAYDQLPVPLRDFVKTANQQWACVPMLRRASKCGKVGRWSLERLIRAYQDEDRATA